MVNKLTGNTDSEKVKLTLTSNTKRKFKIRFGDEMNSGYDFSVLQKQSAYKFTNFLDTIVGKYWNDIDKTYRRKSDRTDIVKNHEIIHYGPSGTHTSLRVHGYIEDDTFVVVRIDPNHSFHN